MTISPRRGGTTNLATLSGLITIALVVAGAWLLRPRDGAAPVAGQQPAPRTEERAAPRAAEPAKPEARRDAGARPAAAESSDDRYDLEADEARGGHTLARHVGRTDAQLRERLDNERGISTASTYASRALAERTVARTLRENQNRVDAWTARRGNRPNLALDYHGRRGDVLGRSIRRGRDPIDCSDAVVVLRWAGRDYYVLTTYPECSR